MTKKIVQNELNIRGKKFKCWLCDEVFDEALYWFDSLYAANYKERIIQIFCGPKKFIYQFLLKQQLMKR